MSASSSTRYTPNDFAYNGRVALALVPCLVTTSLLGGRSVITVLALGSIAGYMCDIMQYRDGAYTASWLTLFATACAFSVAVLGASTAALWTQISLILAVIFVMVLCAMWASLQFKYFQLHNPAVALAFEHMVITASLPAAAIMHTVGLSLFVDVSDLPYYLAVILSVLYAYLGRPLRSSFISARSTAQQHSLASSSITANGPSSVTQKTTNKMSIVASGTCIQTRRDAALMALMTVTLPPLAYAAIHGELLFRHPVHIYSVLLCGSIPLLVVSLLPRGIWWMMGDQRIVGIVQSVMLVCALLGGVVGFEGRVVFHSFSQYIKLSPPWSWIAVTLCLLGVAVIVLAAQQGVLGNSVDVTVAGTALLVCTTAGAIAAGVPLQWLPAPLVAACGLALFFDSRSLREYIVFVAGAFMTGVWFVLQHFWLLNIAVGGLTLHTLCRLALAAVVPALMIPGLVYARVPAAALDVLIMLQATLICVLEERLYVPSHSDFAAEAMYPGWLVVATSALGIMAAQLLARRRYISPVGNWLAHGLYGTKPIMLLLPEAALVLPMALLVLSSTAPLFMIPHAAGARRRVRLPPALAIGHVLSILIALVLARFAIFDIVQFLLSSRPPEGLLLGALVLCAAASLAPLVVIGYSTSQIVQRSLATLVLGGVLLVLLQPPLPLRGGSRCPALPLALCPRLWDERHVPLHDTEDAEIWGAGLARKEHWPRWLLLAALVLGAMAGVLGGPTAPTSAAVSRGAASSAYAGGGGGGGVGAAWRRLVVAMVTGSFVGLYIALEIVPRQLTLQVLVVASCIMVVALVCLLPLPSVRGPLVLPALAAAWLITFGLTMILQAELAPPEAPREMIRLFPDSHKQVEQEIDMATRASLLAVFASQSAILALALKLHVWSTVKAQDAGIAAGSDGGLETNGQAAGFSYFPSPPGRGADLFCGVVPLVAFGKWGRVLRLETSSCGPLLQRLSGVGLAWAPSLGTGCALLAYAMCVSLNVQITGGVPEALFMAAPLLLLMQQDPLIAPGLTAARRYVVPFTATSLSLFTSCIASLVALTQAEETLGYHSRVLGQARPLIPLIGSDSVYTLATQQLLLALAPLPGAFLLTIAMWKFQVLAAATQIWAGALCVATLLMSPQPAAWYLAGTVMLSSVLHHVSVRHSRQASAKII